MIFPTVKSGEVELMEVPSNQRRALVPKEVLLVPPFAMESVPVSMSPAAFDWTAPAPKPTILRPLERIWRPVKDEVAFVPPNFVAMMPWEKVEEAVVEVASMKLVWSWSILTPPLKVEVAVWVLGTEKMVVEALFTMLKARAPAVCSSQMVSLADCVEVPVEVPKADLPSLLAIEKKGSLFEEEAMWRMGDAERRGAVPSIESQAKGEVVPMPNRDKT